MPTQKTAATSRVYFHTENGDPWYSFYCVNCDSWSQLPCIPFLDDNGAFTCIACVSRCHEWRVSVGLEVAGF